MDIEFLKRLKQKLQIGNTRSILLNAYPSRYATRLDITDLNYLQEGLTIKFLENILKKPKFNFKFNINFEALTLDQQIIQGDLFEKNRDRKIKIGLISKRLTSIYYENEDNYLEHGIRTFGLGFPILVYKPKSDPTKLINAPIYIWKLDIQRKKNDWIISRDEDYSISMNEVLLNFLEQDLNVTGFANIPDEYLNDFLLDKLELEENTNNFIREINNNAHKFELKNEIVPLENKDKLKESSKGKGNPWITISGIFGLFRAQKEAVIKDIKELINNFESLQIDNLKVEHYQSIPFTAIETDPTQTKTLKCLREKNKVVIHGPPGTGKSQSLTAIIANALANKKKCLIVCEKKTALEVIKKNLEKVGLGKLCGLIEDVNRDRKEIVNSFRDKCEKVRINFNAFNIDKITKEISEKIDKVNNGHRFYGQIILSNYTWSDLVGQYIRLSKKSKLTKKLYKILKNIEFNHYSKDLTTIYENAVESISHNLHLYKETENFIGFFKILNDRLFTKTIALIMFDLEDYFNSVSTYIKNCLEDGTILINKYRYALKERITEYIRKTDELIEELNWLFDKNNKVNRKLFNEDSKFTRLALTILSLISPKYRLLKKDKKRFKLILDEIIEISRLNYFKSNLKLIDIDLQINKDLVNSHKQNLHKWYENVDKIIEDNLKILNKNNLDTKLNFPINKVDEFQCKHAKIINELNKSDFFNKKFNINQTTFYNEIENLKNINDIIEKILLNIQNIHIYAEWRKHYLDQEDSIKYIIDTLKNFESIDWVIEFKTWFILNTLINYEHKVTLKDDNDIKFLDDNFKKFKNKLIHNTLEYWSDKQADSVSRFNSTHNYDVHLLYNKSRNKHFDKRNSLRKIVNKDFELFTNFFPVLLVNPSVCSSIFKMEEGLFDVVIFDEASQLRIEDVYPALLRGKHKIVSGDENQMPPSNYFLPTLLKINPKETENDDNEETEEIITGLANTESLLDYAITTGYKQTYLGIHYRSKHPDLIEFSNAAFYGTRLKPLPARKDYKAIRYFNVAGLYDQDLGINKAEADKIVEIIDENIDLNNNFLPSIGVATLNIFQRNYIWDTIMKKCDVDTEFEKKIELLRQKKGEELFVKNLENIQGDERDVIIISTTFGEKTDGSKFIQAYGPLNQEKGYRLLNVIITRAKNKMFVCTSIPERFINEYSNLLENRENRGRGIFYAYLAYAKSIEENNFELKDSILNTLARNCDLKATPEDINLTESVFEQEVYDSLIQYIESGRVKTQFKLGGFRIDIVILSKSDNKPIVAIECDGATYHSDPEAYAWDIFRQNFLEEYGLKFIRTWSVNWWNNPQREIERLVKFINDNEE